MARSCYNTARRTIINEYLRQCSDKAVTVKEITDCLETRGIITSPSTVYRYMSGLESEEKVIKSFDDDAKTSRYKLIEAEGCLDHLHLECIRCGKITHLDCEEARKMTEHIDNAHGFEILYTKSVLYGVCSECRKKE